MKRFLILLFSASLLIACGEQNQSSSVDNPVVSLKDTAKSSLGISQSLQTNEEPGFVSNKIIVKNGGSIATSKGTRITVPEHAFTFQDGTPVGGTVDLNFREYHTAGEIIASNIPMVWDSSGHNIQFESAGMFEIRAFQNGNELKLAQGKRIKIDLASRIKGVFNFFSLKEDRSNWNLISRNHKEKPNKEKGEKLKQVIADISGLKKPLPPRELKETDTVFDIDINPVLFPQFADLNGVMWQFAGTDQKQNPLNNPEFQKEKWETVGLYPSLVNDEPVYKIQVERTGKKKEKILLEFMARPLFKGERLKKEHKIFKNNFEEYQKNLARLQAEQKALQMENEFIRSNDLTGLGIFNYDRKYNDENNFQLAATFDFGTKINLAEFPVRVYLISKEENVIIRYYPETYQKFAFNPLVNNKLVALLPSGEVASFSSKDFNTIKLSSLRRGDPYTFILKLSVSKGQSAVQLDEIIASL